MTAASKDITSCRGTLDFLERTGEIVHVRKQVDPVLEVCGITKALDNTSTLMFEKIKRYPNARIMSGLFSRGDRLARIFDLPSEQQLKLKGITGMDNHIPPRVVKTAPCQEVVYDKDIDVLKVLPVTKYTATDPGPILGGGIVYISGPKIGHCVSFKRMHFRGKDWSSMTFNPGGHFEHWVLQARKENKAFPFTVNISPSPAVMAVAGGGGIMPAFPVGYDELGMAGGIQGAPVDICRAKTVDAYAIANAEWVIEGFMDTSQVVWESDEAEKTKDYRAPFFPEAHGHQGRALRTYKVQVTGITHRSDRPIFYAPIGHSFEYPNMSTFVNDAALLKLLNNLRPGLVTDVNSLVGMMGFQGVVIQVKKERRRDDEHINQLILNAFALGASLHWVIVVDEDVDIYDANDVMWALSSRVDGSGDVMVLPPSRGFAGTKGSHGPTAPVSRMGFNATAPWDEKWEYFRGEFPEINLNKWFTDAQVKKLQAQQSEYAKVLAHKRV